MLLLTISVHLLTSLPQLQSEFEPGGVVKIQLSVPEVIFFFLTLLQTWAPGL